MSGRVRVRIEMMRVERGLRGEHLSQVRALLASGGGGGREEEKQEHRQIPTPPSSSLSKSLSTSWPRPHLPDTGEALALVGGSADRSALEANALLTLRLPLRRLRANMASRQRTSS
eukprot:3941827-Rhodomonas_salina.3